MCIRDRLRPTNWIWGGEWGPHDRKGVETEGTNEKKGMGRDKIPCRHFLFPLPALMGLYYDTAYDM